MRVVVALGGNALLRRGDEPRIDIQRANARAAARSLAPLAAEHELVITHGNGPQVGLLASREEGDGDVPSAPLDVLGAESEGMIGYLLEQEVGSALPRRELATLLTQTLVDPNDPALRSPTKFVGPVYQREEAADLERQRGWTMQRDGDHYRRVVGSPAPIGVLELPAIRRLLEGGFLVIAAGGGGVPVHRDEGGALHGIEGVVDKDRASALLAEQLQADALLLLTDVDAVYRDFGTERERAIRTATPKELAADEFAAGSMGPKVEAACRFAAGGGTAYIGALEQAAQILSGDRGTRITARP